MRTQQRCYACRKVKPIGEYQAPENAFCSACAERLAHLRETAVDRWVADSIAGRRLGCPV